MKTPWQKKQSRYRRSLAYCAIDMLITGCLATHAHAEDGNHTELALRHLLDERDRTILSLQKK